MAIRLKSLKGANEALLKRVELSFGVALVGRPISSPALKFLAFDANRDLEAIIAGEPTKHDWLVVIEERWQLIAQGVSSPHAAVAREAMLGVLLVHAFVAVAGGSVEGIEGDDGEAVTPSVSLFDELLRDVRFQQAYQRVAGELLYSCGDFVHLNESAAPASGGVEPAAASDHAPGGEQGPPASSRVEAAAAVADAASDQAGGEQTDSLS